MNTWALFDDWRKNLKKNSLYQGVYGWGGDIQQKYGGSGLLDFGSAAARHTIPGAENVYQSFQRSGEEGKTPLEAISDATKKTIPGASTVYDYMGKRGEQGKSFVPGYSEIKKVIQDYGKRVAIESGRTDVNPALFFEDIIRDAEKKIYDYGVKIGEKQDPNQDINIKNFLKLVAEDAKKQIELKLDKGKPETKKDKKITTINKNNIPTIKTGTEKEVINEADVKSLTKFAGVNLDDMKANWAKKGGMDGLMANPAFTLGLALMQSSAQGKSIGAGALDNFIKAAGISEHYKDRLKDRRNILGPVSDDQRAMVMSALPADIMEPGRIEGLFGGDVMRGHNAALNKVYEEVYEKMAGSKNWDYSKGTQQLKQKDFTKVFNRMVKNGEIKVIQRAGKGSYLTTKDHKPDSKEFQGKSGEILDSVGGWFKDLFRAEGGPVNAGQPYVVGEKGPEIVVPDQNATVLSNDDSQVMSMLLASNPQLQNISRARAEGILRSRFPDYFA
jgi:hypothetical protein